MDVQGNRKNDNGFINGLMQIGLVSFTMLGFLLTALKFPQYGLIANLFAQIFWVYSTYKAWREANQIGMFINTLFITLILLFGIVNYWFW
jgi:hypothetical protein